MLRFVRSRRQGFTLIELLTVIAIITLLIGIVTPALNRARIQAARTAVKATLSAVAAGCEMFKNDYNEFPKSSGAWFGDGTAPTQTNWEVTGMAGANFIVDAMVGRDLIGYDPKQRSATPVYNRWSPNPGTNPPVPNARTGPYMPVDKITTSNDVDKKPKDTFGELPIDLSMPRIDGIRVPVFLDKFEFPILYYRASPTGTPNTRITQVEAFAAPPAAQTTRGTGVYDGRDNGLFTLHNGGATLAHDISQATVPLPANDYVGDTNNFITFIRSLRASSHDPVMPARITFSRPVNTENFILLSPGPDGKFGNLDDVANFEVFSENR